MSQNTNRNKKSPITKTIQRSECIILSTNSNFIKNDLEIDFTMFVFETPLLVSLQQNYFTWVTLLMCRMAQVPLIFFTL